MRIYPIVLIVAFALSTVIGALSNTYFYLASIYYTEPYGSSAANFIVNMLSLIVNPLLLFIIFYSVGKRIETNMEFYSSILSLFLGNAIGLTFGHFVTIIVAQDLFHIYPYVVDGRTVLAVFASSLFPLSFFVGFSALALGYIIKKKQ